MLKHKAKILIVHKCLEYPLRTTIDEHLFAFRRYADADCYYLRLDIGSQFGMSSEPIPKYLLEIDFDIIIFHYGFMSTRWAGRECYERAFNQVLPLKNSKAIKVIMPQDEYAKSNITVEFINNFNIDIVFSVSPESEWPMLYGGVDLNKVKFYKVLTGYLDDKGVKIINKILKTTEKDIDIGYRARNLPQWLGRHGYMKTLVATEFKKHLKIFNLNTDISIDPKDTFFGNGWYKFMVRCKYVIGVEGGATVHDPDGTIAEKGATYLKENPDCTFEEIESVCFPGLDGKLQLIAISPRHLEACATKTCQLLVESSFNGILKPGIHYIEIKKDLSNINEVLETVKNDEKRQQIVENAYRDIVESGKWNYQTAVREVIEKSLVGATDPYFERKTSRNLHLLYYNRVQDWFSWKKYFYWKNIFPYMPNKWTFIFPLINFIKFLGLKNVMKKMYLTLKSEKNDL